ncbi:MFS transporter [Planosporangium mesophilum]|uniref:MFS transporter n=1 Tax=Planosporangium mesophilum TaxID=689768 RepID=A0A8J3X795_9ACTN|nr:MFS transporter [Planosporangium mesophilum]NJC86829.1 MFS transporter [Planosporangium mesophilum]GII26463.1 MFS transporter [Planosporangium mesophilum]
MTSTGTSSPELTTRLATRQSVVAVALLFAANGLILGGYGGALPSIRERLDINATHISILLFAAALAAIIGMQVGGRLSDSIGARQISLAGLLILISAAVVFAFATVFPAAVVGAMLLGLGNGTIDVAMNAVGVQVEVARKRPVMSSFHALWSVGGFTGAGCVLIIATVFGLDGSSIVLPLMLFLAALATVALVIAFRITPPTALVEHSKDGVKTKIPRIAWLLGIMAIGFGLAEGTGTDWSSLHVTEVAQVDSTTGSLGLIAVSGFMVVIRLVGDRIVARFGRRAVVRFGGACAFLGYCTVTLVNSLPLLLAGWALVGLGVGMIAPQVYAVAGHIGGGRVLAVVVTFGYGAFLAGPAVIGFFVTQLGLHHTMAVPAVLCAAIVGLAAVMPKTDSDLSTSR